MKNMKKVIALMLALVMCLCFAACGSGEDDATSAPAEGTSAENTPVSSDTSLEDVKKSGKLTIATSPDFPPFESLEGDKVVGIEIDLLEMIAEKLGVELEINQMDFDSVLPGIQSGKFNVGVSGITVTEDRKKNADFTVPYFAAAQAIVVLKDSPIKSKAYLEGKKVSVQTGTTAEEYCMKNGYDVSAFQANNDALSALTSGKVDAWVIDNETGIQMSETTNGKTVVLDEPMTTEPYSFAFKKGSTSLVNLNFTETVFTKLEEALENTPFAGQYKLIIALAAVILVVLFLSFFLKTNLGLALRATGNNPDMVRSSSVNTATITIIGLCISNSFTALSGCLLAQSQKSANIDMGTGMVTIALASLLIGGILFSKRRGIAVRAVCSVVGALIFRLVYTAALRFNMPAYMLKLVSSVIVIIAISAPYLKKQFPKIKRRLELRSKKEVSKV